TFPTSKRSSPPPASKPWTACSSTSASPRTRSTRPRAASPTPPTGRSTCGWTRTRRSPPPTSSTAPSRTSPSTSSAPTARSLARRPIETTSQLADAVRAAVPFKEEVKSLSRVFQALRIAVNDELAVLERALVAALRVLKPGGRIAVIAYHSLEDRRAKQFLRY